MRRYMSFATAVAACLAAASGVAAGVKVTGRVVDDATGKTIAARVYLHNAAGEAFFVKSTAKDGSAVVYDKRRPEGMEERHVTVSPHPWEIELDPGLYTFQVERGKEYAPVTMNIEAEKQPFDIEIKLRRWIHMAERGWYSGDTHLHRELADMANLVQAEDLNVGFPLSHWITSADVDPIQGNRINPDKVEPVPIKVDADHLIYPLNTEYEIFTVGGKPHTLGAFVLVGHKTPLNIKAPAVVPVAEWAHREGGLIDLEKHSWPWSVAIVPLMKVDLFELANNHCWRTDFAFRKWTIDAAAPYMQLAGDERGLSEWGWIDFGFQTYYAFLNCGFRLQPTAGTASGVHPVPAGFGRVYVRQPVGFNYDNWLAGLRRGDSFVTTGPMLFVTVDGQPGGHVFRGSKPGNSYAIRGTVESAVPIDRVEIIVNGQIAGTLQPQAERTELGAYRAGFVDSQKLDGSGWIAVRVFERHPDERIRFAHSSPVHIEVADRPVAPRRVEAEYLIRRVKEEIDRNRPILSRDAMVEFERALAIYEEIGRRARP